MTSPERQAERRILIAGSQTLLAAGLVHLFSCLKQGIQPGDVTVFLASDDAAELAAAVRSHRPHLVVVPDFNHMLTVDVLHAMLECEPPARLIRISPDCNHALIEDLSGVRLGKVTDLLALIPTDRTPSTRPSAEGGLS